MKPKSSDRLPNKHQDAANIFGARQVVPDTAIAPGTLPSVIQQSSLEPMTISEAHEAAANLVGFFQLLLEINSDRQSTDLG